MMPVVIIFVSLGLLWWFLATHHPLTPLGKDFKRIGKQLKQLEKVLKKRLNR